MDLRAIVMGLAFALMWSSAFTSARMIVAEAPPLLALSARFLISGGLGVAIALALGQSWRLTRPQWKATLIFGLCQNALYLGLNFVAMQWVQASVASIVASTMPLMVALLGRVPAREDVINGHEFEFLEARHVLPALPEQLLQRQEQRVVRRHPVLVPEHDLGLIAVRDGTQSGFASLNPPEVVRLADVLNKRIAEYQ